MNRFALYVHIPFCEHLCHYCDFAKTARYDSELVNKYFETLRREIRHWTKALTDRIGQKPSWRSVFFGGGTPGIFAREYEKLFAEFSPFLANDAEISIEVNPNNVTAEKIAVWTALGFNRISIGVQTFSPSGIKILTRDHDVKSVYQAIALLKKESRFTKTSIDLIYGWPSETVSDWEKDLSEALALEIGHLSLYTLTYEPLTPLGRRYHRGLIKNATNDELSADFYKIACDRLRGKQYRHVELANWAHELDVHSAKNVCRHNQSYWTDELFVGIGAGAHGYLPAEASDNINQKIGVRYSCVPNVHSYIRDPSPRCEKRSSESWLFEYVGSALRSQWGIDIGRMLDRAAAVDWKPTQALKNACIEGHVISSLEPSKPFILSESAWFLENYWAQEVINSVILPEPRAVSSREESSPSSQIKSPPWFARE